MRCRTILAGAYMSKVIGRNIVTAREAAGIRTQSELARRAGVPQPQMNDWEKGRFTPDVMNLLKIAAAIPCSVEALVAGADPGYDNSLPNAKSLRLERQESPPTEKDTQAQKRLAGSNRDAVDCRPAEDTTSSLGADNPERSHESSRAHHPTAGSGQPAELTRATDDLRRTLTAVRATAKHLGIDIATIGLASDEATGRKGAGRDPKSKPERPRIARPGRR